jgi:hypothetical protein
VFCDCAVPVLQVHGDVGDCAERCTHHLIVNMLGTWCIVPLYWLVMQLCSADILFAAALFKGIERFPVPF